MALKFRNNHLPLILSEGEGKSGMSPAGEKQRATLDICPPLKGDDSFSRKEKIIEGMRAVRNTGLRPKLSSTILLLICFCILLTHPGCKVYSFTGASIPADIHTFSVELFQNRSNNGPASLPQTITDKLKQKFQSQANLKQVSSDGDLQFKGSITGFAYTSEAPVAGTTSGLNKLTITIQVDYVNTKDEKDKWTETFSRYAQYSAGLNVVTVEDQLINDISNQLMDDIFQKALVKW